VKEIDAEMAGKRSSLEIYAAILAVAKDGAKKSHIVYKANLNFDLGKKYLGQLTSYGLIQGPSGRDQSFHTTAKGVAYIKHFDGLKELRGESNATLKRWGIAI
jgi:predicted transcriptional regulator